MGKSPYIDVGADFDLCPGCGQRVFKGAMRCTRCGRTLMTLEEQLERIEGLKAKRKDPGAGRVVRFLFFLLIAGSAWYLFSDWISALVRSFLAR